MKKWLGLLLVLLLVLIAGCALAGGPVSGEISVTQLQTNSVMDGDTWVTINSESEQQSIKGNYNLTFRGGGHIVTFSNNSGPAVQAKSITFSDCHVLLPYGATVKNGVLCDDSGKPASYVMIGPLDCYGIEVVNGVAYDWHGTGTCNYATAGMDIGFDFIDKKCPDGKYASGQKCQPADLNVYMTITEKTFKMPAHNVKITPVYSPQLTRIIDLRYSEYVQDPHSDAFMSLFIAASDFKLINELHSSSYDLDKNGTYDIYAWAEEIGLLDTNSIPVSITIKPPKAAKYNPLTFVFSSPTVSFNANGGKGTMKPVKVGAKNLKYQLPECTLTPPKGKEFVRWNKGAPGTLITVTENTVLKAVWGKGQVTKSGAVYKLNHKKQTATLVRFTKTKVQKFSVPDKITANGMTYKITQIKAKAFKGLKKLTKVTIGSNVVKIGASAFEGCVKLKNISILSAKLKKDGFGSKCFKDIPSKAVFTVPKAQVKNYRKWILNPGKAPNTITVKAN